MRVKRTMIYAGLGLLLTALLSAFIYWYLIEEPKAGADESAVMLAQGIALFEQKQYPEALQQLEKIPDDSVTDWRIPYYRGSSWIMLKDYQSATTSLEQALALNNNEIGILYALGVAYFKLGNLKLSKSYFASVLEINPADQHAKGLMDIMAKLERQPEGSYEVPVHGSSRGPSEAPVQAGEGS